MEHTFFFWGKLLLLITPFCNIDVNLLFAHGTLPNNAVLFHVIPASQRFLPNFKRQEDARDQDIIFFLNALESLSHYIDLQNRCDTLNIAESCFQR